MNNITFRMKIDKGILGLGGIGSNGPFERMINGPFNSDRSCQERVL